MEVELYSQAWKAEIEKFTRNFIQWSNKKRLMEGKQVENIKSRVKSLYLVAYLTCCVTLLIAPPLHTSAVGVLQNQQPDMALKLWNSWILSFSYIDRRISCHEDEVGLWENDQRDRELCFFTYVVLNMKISQVLKEPINKKTCTCFYQILSILDDEILASSLICDALLGLEISMVSQSQMPLSIQEQTTIFFCTRLIRMHWSNTCETSHVWQPNSDDR